MVLEKLSQVLSAEYRGPRAMFTESHVLKAILVIGKAGSVGRGKLGELLSLGQGEVRTLIRRMKDNDLIAIKASGCVLTEKGQREYNLIMKAVPWSSTVNASSLGLGKYSFAVIVRDSSKRVKKGIEQRDAAIKSGANGALSVIYTGDRFIIPVEGTDCEGKSPKEPWISIRKGEPKDGDVVIVSGAEDAVNAEYGALSAVLTLV